MSYADSLRWVTALPVYNEVRHVREVLKQVLEHSPEVIVVDDGSTDGTAEVLKEFPQITVLTHRPNKGYGAALRTAFDHAVAEGYDVVVTIDSDGQHQPGLIRQFVDATENADIVSGSRYLTNLPGDSPAPEERRRINRRLTDELNRRLGFELTDAFCGFKAYRVEALAKLELTENGYAMPLELWVEASSLRLIVKELPVPRIYLDENRSFGGALDDGATRLEYYHLTVDRSLARIAAAGWRVPCGSGVVTAPVSTEIPSACPSTE
jgi:glycosyltransferase involved in cell wall biosynthesis